MRKLLILSLLVALFSACSKNKDDIAKNSGLNGTWVYSTHDGDAFVYVLEEDFDKEASGVKLKKSGKLVKRQNAGWCGTPPIHYEEVDGSWTMPDENTIELTYPYWGGTATDTWQIVSSTDTELRIVYVD